MRRPAGLAQASLVFLVALAAAACAPNQAPRLAVGDCFDPPEIIGEPVTDLATIPCTSPHGAEVVAVYRYEPDAATLPTEDDFRAFLEARCPVGFLEYTGLDFATAEYDMSALTPTPEDWTAGRRDVICYAVSIGGGPLTESIRKQ